MSLRDAVDNCGDGSRAANPVLRMIDQFTSEKQAFRDKWANQRMYAQNGPQAGPSVMGRPGAPRSAAGALAEFEEFEEAELSRAMGQYAMDPHADPARMARMGYPPTMGMLPPHMMKGMPPGMPMDRAMFMREGPANAKEAEEWEKAYAEADEDAEMFEMFARNYGMKHAAGPQGAPGAPMGRFDGPRPQAWAEEFDSGAKFAEWDQIYQARTGPSKGWTDEFEKELESMPEDQLMDDLEKEWDERGAQAAVFDPKIAKENQLLASQITSVQDPKFRQSELFQLLSAISNGDVAFEGDKVVPLPQERREAMEKSVPQAPVDKWASEFEELERPGGVWGREFEEFNGGASSAAPGEYDAPLNEAELLRQKEEFDRKFGDSWAQEFNAAPLGEGIEEEDEDEEINQAFSNFVTPEYELATDNPMSADPEAFTRGKALFDAGRLNEAITAFEAAVKQDPHKSIAWQFLGAAHAENDRDDLASQALLKAIQADPDNREALITLSVSYINDNHQLRALECLQQWLATSEYADRVDTNVQLGREFHRNHELITNLFISAARLRAQDPDADVQIALGLLYNLNEDYERAIDCFKIAAMKRPGDYLVWNKLGATQSNSKQLEDAIDSFARALEIKPAYTRACSNLGISFTGLDEYGEAAKAFLSALALNPDAKHQWDNLRNVFSLMRRPDLLKMCDIGDISLFMEEFHF